MSYKNLRWLLVLPMMLIALQANALEKHTETTAPAGNVVFFLKVAYPTPIEQIAFMSNVFHQNGVKVSNYLKQLTDSEAAEFNRDRGAYMERVLKPPRNYKPDQEKLMELGATIRDYDPDYLEDDSIINKYNVKEFPSFLYFAPNGNLHRFAFKPYNFTKSANKFWKIFKQHKDNKPRKKMWKNKKWSQ